MKSRVLFILFSCSILFSATAQPTGYYGYPEKRFIEVTGTAELQVVPDEIYINLTLKEVTEWGNKVSIKEQESRLKKALINKGVPVENKLSLTDATAQYMRASWSKNGVIKQAKYTLMVHNAACVQDAFEVFEAMEIKGAYIADVDHSKMDSLKAKVRIDAIKAAKSKASSLLEAIGEKCGKALIVRENNHIAPTHANINLANSKMKSSYGNEFMEQDAEILIEFSKITLLSSIYTKFEIDY